MSSFTLSIHLLFGQPSLPSHCPIYHTSRYMPLVSHLYLYLHFTLSLPVLLVTQFSPHSVPLLLCSSLSPSTLLYFYIPQPKSSSKSPTKYSPTCPPNTFCHLPNDRKCPVI
ncbi:hypothetical protein ATANTOWER_000513 [Ataeniobius toweri]|uniref:Uncharacterized protein n=1 Tax=Ataeniobius toweri TaxID=208326 RepID=A0ABU7CGV4_9TELE|nr:hypothetical protein [Ataeniobius toweri]